MVLVGLVQVERTARACLMGDNPACKHYAVFTIAGARTVIEWCAPILSNLYLVFCGMHLHNPFLNLFQRHFRRHLDSQALRRDCQILLLKVVLGSCYSVVEAARKSLPAWTVVLAPASKLKDVVKRCGA